MNPPTIRKATPTDADTIASLHTQSWLTAYRGIVPDAYLDNNLAEERKAYWSKKIPTLSPKEFVLIAENETTPVGFATVFDKPENGYDALLDNLHVRPDSKGQGIGGRLLQAVAIELLKTGRKSFYLWVLNGNTSAAEFYKAHGGQPTDHSTSTSFGGEALAKTRFVWDRLDRLANLS